VNPPRTRAFPRHASDQGFVLVDHSLDFGEQGRSVLGRLFALLIPGVAHDAGTQLLNPAERGGAQRQRFSELHDTSPISAYLVSPTPTNDRNDRSDEVALALHPTPLDGIRSHTGHHRQARP
jgi:hypothetical protein